ncbi:hypothetical protein [Allomeiothermus silvanus]|uniref:hypothetical protein n=1 Tax=Allomeiothermus silvanus TaxID=52022 RepID=UPI0023EF840F|nr:hypothetical protein [Allomeiothermus silvanus]
MKPEGDLSQKIEQGTQGFREAHEYYKKQLKASAWGLWVSASIVFILILLVVGGYLFDFTWLPWLGPLSQRLGGESAGQGVSFVGLVGRLVLTLPFVWIFFIQVKNYRINFNLHQAYLHRKIIADTLPGLQDLILTDGAKGFVRELLCTLYRNPLPEPTERDYEERKEEGQVEKQKEEQEKSKPATTKV